MSVKLQRHLLKAVGGVVLTRYLPLYALIVLKHEKVKNVNKSKKKKKTNFKIL